MAPRDKTDLDCLKFLKTSFFVTTLLFALSWWALSLRNTELVHIKTELEEQLRILTENVEKSSNQTEVLQENARLITNLSESLKDHVDRLTADKNDLHVSLVKMEEELNTHKNISSSLAANITWLDSELNSWKELAESRSSAMKALEREKTVLTAQLAIQYDKITKLSKMLIVDQPQSTWADRVASDFRYNTAAGFQASFSFSILISIISLTTSYLQNFH